MELVPETSYAFDLNKEIADSGWITRFIPFAGGRAVAFCHTGGNRCWFVELANGKIAKRPVPQRIVEEYYALQEGDHQEQQHDVYSAHRGEICAFKYGERLGLLLSDRIVYLFSSIHDDPVAIRVQNHFAKRRIGGTPFSTLPASCGNTADHNIPVIFNVHEAGGLTPGHSLLEIDEPGKTARWKFKDEDDYPRELRFREHDGIFLHDFAWTGRHSLIFSIGASVHYKYGMDFSVLLRGDSNAENIELDLEVDEDAYGKVCASLDKVLLTPFRKNGPRKGKQSFFDLSLREEIPVKLPRGLTKYKIIEAFDQYVWLINDVWFSPQREPVRIVACKQKQ